MKSFILLMIMASLTINVMPQTKNGKFQPANTKYEKWQRGSFFRGYNVLYESPKTLQDFIDFKNYGGNLFHIQPDGFFNPDPPYDTMWADINGADMLVNFCRQAGIYYVIGMRSGPGAYDTFNESQGETPESRIWNKGNTVEQQKYADMLKMVVQRYANDTLFVGINLVIEPRPKVRQIPANTSQLYKFFLENVYDIHMDQVYNFLISNIREVNSEIPVIIENFGYSTPELFPAYTVNDAFAVYSAHNYQPNEFTKADTPMSMSYPGNYWNITKLSQQLYDKDFLRDIIFAKLREFKESTGAPVFIGEFGMFKPQIGGADYIKDVLDICTDNGWSFALWDWRRGGGQNWNIEGFQDSGSVHWKTVLSKFNAPPVPGLISPVQGGNANEHPAFTWDSLTAFTTYDLEINLPLSGEKILIQNIGSSHFTLDSTALIKGLTYTWRVRSKNPGGSDANNSKWSAYESFYVPVPDNNNENTAFELSQNSPNPFNPSTVIGYTLKMAGNVSLIIYDILGREISKLINQFETAGHHAVSFNASSLPSGVYFYKLDAKPNDGSKGFTEIKRMVLVK